jgi:hypothetical protein
MRIRESSTRFGLKTVSVPPLAAVLLWMSGHCASADARQPEQKTSLTTHLSQKAYFGRWGIDLSARDMSVKPGDDFERFASGKWMDAHDIPGNKSEIGLSSDLVDRNELRLRTVVMSAPITSSIGAFYASYMDEALSVPLRRLVRSALPNGIRRLGTRPATAFIAAALLAVGSSASGQSLDIGFDYSNADATLSVFKVPDQTAFANLMALRSTSKVIEKLRTRVPSVTADLYQSSLRQTVLGQKGQADPFQWRDNIAEQDHIRSLLLQLHSNEASIKAQLLKALEPNLLPGMHLSVTVHYVMGGVSSGWEDGANDFYIGLPFYHGDPNGVVWTMQHELFHNAQYVGFHDQARDLARLGPRQQEVYRLLDELFREGTATYVGDVSSFSPGTPYIDEMRVPAAQNNDRMSDNFALLDTLLFRLSNDPTAHFDDVQSIGFDWNWQNPMYFTGAYMAKYLVGHGKNLRDYLRKRPTAFIRDYIEICRVNHCQRTISQMEADDIIELDDALSEPTADGAARR